MLRLDGSYGEGGGQILRSSLALSVVTGTAFRLENIRARRKNPGLQRQHLTAVLAAAEVGRAEVSGATLRSKELTFRPGGVAPGEHRFAVGTAGSATLVLQTVLPPLLLASSPSALVLEGGTHNIFAPPFDFLERAFLPLVRRMGPEVQTQLVRPGFYPAGQGRVEVRVVPVQTLGRLELPERGELQGIRAQAMVSWLPRHIAERELEVIGRRLGLQAGALEATEVRDPKGPGNVVLIEVQSQHVTEVFTGFGERGVPAETVAERAVSEAERYLAATAPVGEHLADQLLLPMALAGGGMFRTLEPTEHTRTNAEVIAKFLPVQVRMEQLGQDDWQVQVQSRA